MNFFFILTICFVSRVIFSCNQQKSYAPVKEMEPALVDNGEPENLYNNIYIFMKHGMYYLAYVADENQKIELNLPGDKKYKLEVFDTWNMKTMEEKEIDQGVFSYTTENPYTAIRIIKL